MLSANQTRQRGFTLIELVVVIVIIGILAAFAIPRFANIAADARRSTVNGMAGTLRSTSALVHGLALARNNPASVLLENKTINIVFSYPAGTNVSGIGDSLSNVDGFGVTETPGPPATIRFTPTGLTNPTTTCSALYTAATSAAIPASVSQDVTNCD